MNTWLAAFLADPPQTDDCVLWPFGRYTQGYGQVWADGRSRGVHVIACEHFHGPRPPGMYACHSHAGNKHCCNPRHLRWDTPKANSADMVAHGTSAGTHVAGEQHPNAKLTAAQVAEIRERHAAGGISGRALAREYGVSNVSISYIVRRISWV